MSTDSEFMLEALALARMGWGLTNPNPMVGAVLVKNGEVIGRGFHHKAGEAHAEINALSDASRHGHDVKGATLRLSRVRLTAGRPRVQKRSLLPVFPGW